MGSTPRKRALVVAGAGSAIEFGAPSTAALTARVEERVRKDSYLCSLGADRVYEKIRVTLADYLDGGASAVNFEHIFHCAEQLLSNTFEPTLGAVDEFKPILYPFVGRWVALNEQDALQALVRQVPDILFDELSVASDKPAVDLAPLDKFISYLRDDQVVRIYTTNYDDFILQADDSLYHGFDRSPGSGPRVFQPETFWASANENALLHLHGSVHFGFPPPDPGATELNALRWFHNRSEARRHASFNGGPERQMDGSVYYPSALITGFSKLSRMQQTPFSHYYAALSRDAMTSDMIILIGFGLTDLHILAALADAGRRRPSPPILFIDFFEHGFHAPTMWNIDTKHIEMLHSLKMLILDTYSGVAASQDLPGWTIAENGSCAVWDRGFLQLLNTLDELPTVLDRLKFA